MLLSYASLGKFASWVKQKLGPRVKALNAERQAYESGMIGMTSPIEQSFNETYDRLVSTGSTSSLLTAIESKLFVPSSMKGASVQEWLNLAATKENLFKIAHVNLLNGQGEPSQRVDLQQTYAKITGESPSLAEGFINSVVAALAAGYQARLDEPTRFVIDSALANSKAISAEMSDGFEQTKEKLELMSESLSRQFVQSSEALATAGAAEQLELILKTRSFDPKSKEKIKILAERVRVGDLSSASGNVKDRVFLLAARILLSNEEPVADSEKYISLVSKDKSTELAVVQALLQVRSRKYDVALQILREIETPDGRAAFVWTLIQAKRGDDAINWFERQVPPLTPSALTAMGWITLANAYVGAERWEDAILTLEFARPLAENFPDLYFIEGIHRAAMVVPLEFRSSVLDGRLIGGDIPVIEGDAPEKWRASAIPLLKLAQSVLTPLDSKRAEYAGFCCLWLALGGRDDSVRELARRDVTEKSTNLVGAVMLYPVTRQFQIPVDREAIASYLEARRSIGGLSDSEWTTRFFLALDTQQPAGVLKFLDECEGELAGTIEAPILVQVRISALLACDGQATRARAELNVHMALFSDAEFKFIDAKISATEGVDILPALDNLYKEDPSLRNLHALVGYLAKVDDIETLEPLAKQLYGRERTAANARVVVGCIQHFHGRGAVEVVNFLESEKDVVGEVDELQSELAWAYLEIGQWKQAKTINDRLLKKQPSAEQHIGLDINIAVKSGDWDSFTVIFEREWLTRESHSSQTLLLLATLASEGQTSPDRAFELVKLAVGKANNDPKFLLAGYQAAVQFGKEGELSASWLTVAAETDTTDLVRKISMTEIVEEVLPTLRRRNQSALDALANSTAPIHVLVGLLNMPLARFYCSIPIENKAQADIRKRELLPFFGVRINDGFQLEKTSSIALDVSAILTLTMLDLLPAALDAFSKVFVAPDTMRFLLNEKRRVRFQQPSEVRLAEGVLRAIEQSSLRPDICDVSPPEWLIQEVGIDLAKMLEKAKAVKGVVVASSPVFRANGLLDALADLREYSSIVATVRTFVLALENAGRIAHKAAASADALLKLFDRGERVPHPDNIVGAPIYIDMVTVRHLQQTGVLAAGNLSQLEVYVLPSVQTELQRTIREAAERERVVNLIDSARTRLRIGMEAERVHLAPERPSNQKYNSIDSSGFNEALTMRAFLQSSEEIDALVIDDLYFTRLSSISDENGHSAHIASTLDVIDALTAQGTLDKDAALDTRHQLRTMGVAFVAINQDELWSLLERCGSHDDSSLQESLELKTLRQTIIHSCTLPFGDIRDRLFFANLGQSIDGVLTKLWGTDDISLERASSITRWIFENLLRTLWTAVSSKPVPSRELGSNFVAMSIGGLLIRAAMWSGQRRSALHTIVAEAILEPAKPANGKVLDAIASFVVELLLALQNSRDDIGGADQLVLGCLGRLPELILDRISTHAVFGSMVRTIRTPVLSFSNELSLSVVDLYESAEIAVREGMYSSTSLPLYRIVSDGRHIKFEIDAEGLWNAIDIPELGGMLPTPERRIESIDKVLAECGPTFLAAHKIRSSISDDVVSIGTLNLLLEERLVGVNALWRRIYAGRSQTPLLNVVAPKDFDYYSKLLGRSTPTSDIDAYFSDVLLPYWKMLVQRDLASGLRIALYGFVHPTLAPSKLLEGIHDDDLWDAIAPLRSQRDPYSVLGLAEISLGRLFDERFQNLAGECIERLCETGDANSIQSYAATSLFAEIALGEIQGAEGAMNLPPFWKRMAAWMQGGIVVSHHPDFRFKIDALRSWVNRNLTIASRMAEIIDMHNEPMASSASTKADACRDNVLRILTEIADSTKEAGYDIPNYGLLRSIVQTRESDQPVDFKIAGPVRCLSDRIEEKFEQTSLEFLELKFSGDSTLRVWSALALICQLAVVPKDAYSVGRQHLKEVVLRRDDVDWAAKVSQLISASAVSVTCEDIDLADCLRDLLLRFADQMDSEERVSIALQVLFLAAGAYRELEIRQTWLDDASSRIALALPSGIASSTAGLFFSAFSKVSTWRAGPALWAELHARSAS